MNEMRQNPFIKTGERTSAQLSSAYLAVTALIHTTSWQLSHRSRYVLLSSHTGCNVRVVTRLT